jgi:hypothetical protein
MRSDPRIDDATPVFTLSCGGYRPKHRHTGGTMETGRLSFSIDDAVVAEIGHEDLLESWQAAGTLTASESEKMTALAGARLAEILSSGLETADLTEAVTDAAVVFLLAMKRQGISSPKRIPACSVMWNGHENRERVLLGA